MNHIPRTDFEIVALELFRSTATDLGHTPITGQGVLNRISLDQGVFFQFGDLRVETPSRHVIVEVESAGGITNLVKYWLIISSGRVGKPIFLLHLFRIDTDYSWVSHRRVWAFLYPRMHAELAPRFEAKLFTYRDGDLFHEALEEFRRVLQPPDVA